MTPALFDLPIRLGDAAALAGVLLNTPESTQSKPLTDGFRARVAARAGSVKFESMKPLFGSIERDPVHPSAFYICVDGIDDQPFLLRAAPASTPSSGLFPKAILIGRTFIGRQEAVLNAVPFGVADEDRILTFSDHVNRAFQPKSSGSRPVIRISAGDPAATFPVAFEGFRRLLRDTGQNQAAFALAEGQDPAAFCFTAMWSAIRAGWREGYTLQSDAPVAPLPGLRRRPFEAELNVIRDIRLTAGMTRDDILALF